MLLSWHFCVILCSNCVIIVLLWRWRVIFVLDSCYWRAIMLLLCYYCVVVVVMCYPRAIFALFLVLLCYYCDIIVLLWW